MGKKAIYACLHGYHALQKDQGRRVGDVLEAVLTSEYIGTYMIQFILKSLPIPFSRFSDMVLILLNQEIHSTKSVN